MFNRIFRTKNVSSYRQPPRVCKCAGSISQQALDASAEVRRMRSKQLEPAELDSDVTISRARFQNSKEWTTGQTITIGFMTGGAWTPSSLTFAQRKAWVKQQVEDKIAPNTFLTYEFLCDADVKMADIRIKFDSNDGAWSYLGTDALAISSNSPTMNLGWIDSAEEVGIESGHGTVVQHEFGHMLGLVHEHQTENFPHDWDEAAVEAELMGPPNNWDLATIQANLYDIVLNANSNGGAYDPLSVMHYFFEDDFFVGSPGLTQNLNLSTEDEAQLTIRYPGGAGTFTDEPEDCPETTTIFGGSALWIVLGAVLALVFLAMFLGGRRK